MHPLSQSHPFTHSADRAARTYATQSNQEKAGCGGMTSAGNGEERSARSHQAIHHHHRPPQRGRRHHTATTTRQTRARAPKSTSPPTFESHAVRFDHGRGYLNSVENTQDTAYPSTSPDTRHNRFSRCSHVALYPSFHPSSFIHPIIPSI